MERVVTIDSVALIDQVLALDDPSGCSECGRDDAQHSRSNVTELMTWWLGEPQRQLWRASTRVEARQRDGGEASSNWFIVKWDECPIVVPVFVVMNQHSLNDRRKALPHYQLQIPCRKKLFSAAQLAGLKDEVRALADDASARVKFLRYSGNESISLHRPLGHGLRTVFDVVSGLVSGIRLLRWRQAEPFSRPPNISESDGPRAGR